MWAQPAFQTMHPYSTSIFDTCEDCTPANLPAGLSLLPEQSMYYGFLSQDNTDALPSQKVFKLSQAETAKLNRQILSLHVHPIPSSWK